MPTMQGHWEPMSDVMALGLHSHCQSLLYTREPARQDHVIKLDLKKKGFRLLFFYTGDAG